jgi:hypothetical protein
LHLTDRQVDNQQDVEDGRPAHGGVEHGVEVEGGVEGLTNIVDSKRHGLQARGGGGGQKVNAAAGV